MDLRADEEGVWPGILPVGSGRGGRGWAVQAGPIEHRGEFDFTSGWSLARKLR